MEKVNKIENDYINLKTKEINGCIKRGKCFCHNTIYTFDNFNKDDNLCLKYRVKIKGNTEHSKYTYIYFYNSHYNNKICLCSDYKSSNDILLIQINGDIFLGNELLNDYDNNALSFENVSLDVIFIFDFKEHIIKIHNKKDQEIVTAKFPLGYNENLDKTRLLKLAKGEELDFKEINDIYKPFYFGIASCDLIENEETIEYNFNINKN